MLGAMLPLLVNDPKMVPPPCSIAPLATVVLEVMEPFRINAPDCINVLPV